VSCIPILMSASPPLILGKSRVRKRARTDLCGGRSAMVVPTATVIRTDNAHLGEVVPKGPVNSYYSVAILGVTFPSDVAFTKLVHSIHLAGFGCSPRCCAPDFGGRDFRGRGGIEKQVDLFTRQPEDGHQALRHGNE
jgi:hypothetical protein